jgi:Flp pilus assembly protein TadG
VKSNGSISRRGLAAVELAAVLPLLLTIVLACVDFGRFGYAYIAVSNAAREGAAFAGRTPWTSGTDAVWQLRLRATVEDELGCGEAGSRFVASNVTIAIPTQTTISNGKTTITTPVTTDPDKTKRVGIRVLYPFSTLVSWPGIPGQMTLARTVTMRVYR